VKQSISGPADTAALPRRVAVARDLRYSRRRGRRRRGSKSPSARSSFPFVGRAGGAAAAAAGERAQRSRKKVNDDRGQGRRLCDVTRGLARACVV